VVAPTRRAKVRRAAGKLSLLIGSTLLTLLAAELAFRAFDIRGYHERRRELGLQYAYILDEEKRVPNVGVQYRPYAKFGHAYDSDPRGYFDDGNQIIYALNKHGFRGGDYEREKAPRTRRVVLLGDSFTFGEGVRFEDTFGYRLQEILDQDEEAVEVLNFAVGGWGTRNQISYLERAGLRFEPDLVIVVYVLNDAGYAGGLDLWRKFREQYQNRRLKGSYLASYFYAAIARRTLARSFIEELVGEAQTQRQNWRESLAFLAHGKRITESAQARYAVAIFPFLYGLDESYPFRSLHGMISDFCTERGIAVLDLFDAFEGRSDTDLWVHPSDQHPNREGHRIAAEALAAFIQREDLLPKLAPTQTGSIPEEDEP
jgi:lysophospholipase L1-like esterase